MRRIYRITKKIDFQILFRRGIKIEMKLWRIILGRNIFPHSRFAFIAARSIDKRAVVRNRLRRRAHEWFRKGAYEFTPSIDIAFVFKKEVSGAPRAVFYEELARALQEIYTHVEKKNSKGN